MWAPSPSACRRSRSETPGRPWPTPHGRVRAQALGIRFGRAGQGQRRRGAPGPMCATPRAWRPTLGRARAGAMHAKSAEPGADLAGRAGQGDAAAAVGRGGREWVRGARAGGRSRREAGATVRGPGAPPPGAGLTQGAGHRGACPPAGGLERGARPTPPRGRRCRRLDLARRSGRGPGGGRRAASAGPGRRRGARRRPEPGRRRPTLPAAATGFVGRERELAEVGRGCWARSCAC